MDQQIAKLIIEITRYNKASSTNRNTTTTNHLLSQSINGANLDRQFVTSSLAPAPAPVTDSQITSFKHKVENAFISSRCQYIFHS